MLAILRGTRTLRFAALQTLLPLRYLGKSFAVSTNSRDVGDQNVDKQHDLAAVRDDGRVPAVKRKRLAEKQSVVPGKKRTSGRSVLQDSGCSEIRNTENTSADTTRKAWRRYTPEQRQDAVDAVVSGKFTVLKSSRIYGIPANTLYRWWLEHRLKHMHPKDLKSPRKRYNEADIHDALASIHRLGSAAAASREHNINVRTLYRWRRRAVLSDGSRTERRVTRGYSEEERQAVLAALKTSTPRQIGRRLNIPHTTIRDWAALESLRGKASARTAEEGAMPR